MTIIFERVARNVCTILINRPHKRNALDLATIKCLQRNLKQFEEDDELHVAVLSGVGGSFCAGYDLNDFIRLDREGLADLEQVKQMLWPLGLRLSNKKVTVAAVEGHAAGFGYELALKCDFRIADRDARMGFLNRRLGIPIMNGGTVMLPRLVGGSRAMDIVATGKAQLAPEALSYGLLVHVSDIGCALGRSINLGRSLAKFHQPSLLKDLKSLTSNQESSYIDLLHKERAEALEYLEGCGPFDSAVKFLNGQLFRHGSSDMGNLIVPEPTVTL